jgi:RimJ/RimL family protein N-acetyltransferase
MTEPLLIDLPASLQTQRLLLRPPATGDGPLLFSAITDSLPALRRFLGALPWVATEQSAQASELYCRNAQANFLARKDLPFLLFDKASGELVGASGLHRPDWSTPKVEIGYWVRSSCSGRGYISEAVQALKHYAFTHLQAARIELVTDEHNLASRRVAERNGFTLEGILRHSQRAPDGSLRDICMYAALAPVR